MKKDILKKDIDRLKKKKLRENGRTFPPANETPRRGNHDLNEPTLFPRTKKLPFKVHGCTPA